MKQGEVFAILDESRPFDKEGGFAFLSFVLVKNSRNSVQLIEVTITTYHV